MRRLLIQYSDENLIHLYIKILASVTLDRFGNTFDVISGYYLGVFTVALFSEQVGRTILGFYEDSGDIAGMGSDLFGSFSDSTCAAFVIYGSSIVFQGVQISSGLHSLIQISWKLIKNKTHSKHSIISAYYINSNTNTILLLNGLPVSFSFFNIQKIIIITTGIYLIIICALVGLCAGLLIGYIADYYTSNKNISFQDLAFSCK